jgi:hypothetical protein
LAVRGAGPDDVSLTQGNATWFTSELSREDDLYLAALEKSLEGGAWREPDVYLRLALQAVEILDSNGHGWIDNVMRYAKHNARSSCALPDRRDGVLVFTQHAPGMYEKDPSRLCQHHATRMPFEEGSFKDILQPPDLKRNGGLADVLFLGGFGDGAEIRDGHE